MSIKLSTKRSEPILHQYEIPPIPFGPQVEKRALDPDREKLEHKTLKLIITQAIFEKNKVPAMRLFLMPQARLHCALILAQAGFAGFEILSRITLDQGAGKFAFSFYRNCVAMVVLAIGAYLFERRVTLNQVLYLAGLEYTSPVFASAMRNTTPVLTFILAWIFRLEVVRLKRVDGVAKVIGCLLGILGSIFLSVYRGPIVIQSTFKFPNVKEKGDKGFYKQVHIQFIGLLDDMVPAKTIGSIYLILSCLAFSVFLIFQGFIASGFVSGVQSWAIHQGGPVIVSTYQPLETTITAILGFFFLKETLYMGSILGGIIVILGLYMLIWGQSQHHKYLKQISSVQESQQNIELQEPSSQQSSIDFT
ncbi:protein WALLS ARE THIN 1 [Selaginella moellendorffii]|uniref:protein WALLS ARE THIN 1 n=1 Tax=Selaginella moellendorffii TaxID=88036 RepID=UPI000D1D0724|nr:protein WALLS ARE THIN 1 [Selaginella moellendorffii]|eukprot:XP_024535197.1 protein WALLS ARE THIN 1 [Selaginella moellendorffii]